MLRIAKLLVSGGTCLSLLSLSITSSFAATATISGNGQDSSNSISIISEKSVSISQSNTTSIINNIGIVSNTGGDTANKNTGGDVSITTGDSNVSVAISNTANKNNLDLGIRCGCLFGGGFDVSISGNGTDSLSKVTLNTHNRFRVSQKNKVYLSNSVWVQGSTGHNDSNKNTGGNVSISTGDATSSISVRNEVNSNSLMF